MNKIREYFSFIFWGIWFGLVAILLFINDSMPLIYPIGFLAIGTVLSLIAYLLRAKRRGQMAFNSSIALLWALLYSAIGFPNLATPSGDRQLVPTIFLFVFALAPFGLLVLFRRKEKLANS